MRYQARRQSLLHSVIATCLIPATMLAQRVALPGIAGTVVLPVRAQVTLRGEERPLQGTLISRSAERLSFELVLRGGRAAYVPAQQRDVSIDSIARLSLLLPSRRFPSVLRMGAAGAGAGAVGGLMMGLLFGAVVPKSRRAEAVGTTTAIGAATGGITMTLAQLVLRTPREWRRVDLDSSEWRRF